MATAKQIKESIVDQLKAQNRCNQHTLDMVDRYMELRRLAGELKRDIYGKEGRGLRYKTVNGNGIEVEKDNASVRNLSATVQAMSALRQKMHLDDPAPVKEEGFEGYM